MSVVPRVIIASVLVHLWHFGVVMANERPPSIKDCKKKGRRSIDCRNMGFLNIPYDIFSNRRQIVVYLGGNPFVCDCSLVWFLREPKKNRARIMDWSNIRCAYPDKFNTKPVIRLKEADICDTKLLKMKDVCRFRQDGIWYCLPNNKLQRPPFDLFHQKGEINMYGEFICDCDIVSLIRRLRTKKDRDRFADYKALLCKPFKKNRVMTEVYKFTENDVCPQKAPDRCKTRPSPCPETAKCVITKKSLKCVDIDECATGRWVCQKNEVCHNKKNGYKCRCRKGYKRNKISKKCVVPDPCKDKPNLCPKTSRCENIRLSSQISYRCVDIDECLENTATITGKNTKICETDEECHNKENGYECRCKKGMKREKGFCISAIDPCKKKPPVCKNKSERCVNGKNFNLYTCEDMNECSTNQHDCHADAKCINIIPGYKCRCKPGFREYNNGRLCKDLNECSDKSRCATENSKCVNLPGSYKCECETGFVGDGKYCKDIDECVVNDDCGIYAECKNIIGSYKCICSKGYYGNGKICKDIDECSQNACPAHSVCKNSPGSYSCKCLPGYQFENDRCLDVDECKAGSHTCDRNALCINQIGGYKCLCNEGYQHLNNGRLCLKEVSSEDNSSLLVVFGTVAVSLLVISLLGLGLYIERKNRVKRNLASTDETKLLMENEKNKAEAVQPAAFMFNPHSNREATIQDDYDYDYADVISSEEEKDYDDN